jgi:ATP-dependent DNA helicase RecQ
MSVIDLQRGINLTQGQIDKVLKILSVDNPAPVLKVGPIWVRTPVAWSMDHERIQRLTSQRELEWQEVQEYIDHTGCLMMYLAAALDDKNTQPCGKCAGCLGRLVISADFGHGRAVAAALYLQHSEFPLECKKQVATGAFEQYGFRGNLPQNLRAETGRILSRFGDAGWGHLVKEDKHAGRFRDELVEAVAEMVRERWQPNPPPFWVTCVPSRNHPELVPDFARHLADRLELPFVDAVSKVRDNAQQKIQQNRFHQCRNLDGVFAVADAIPHEAVLLVDDMVDSGWTMTVVAALLLRSGSGPVWPVALASTSSGD